MTQELPKQPANVTQGEKGDQDVPWLIPSNAQVRTRIRVRRMKKKRVYSNLTFPYVQSGAKLYTQRGDHEIVCRWGGGDVKTWKECLAFRRQLRVTVWDLEAS